MNKQFNIFLLVVLSFFVSLNLSASDTFFSAEKEGVRVLDFAKGGGDLFTGSRQFVRDNYGQDFLNQITKSYGKENTGALAVIVKRFGDEGADLLKAEKSLDEIASALIEDRILFRHIGSQAGYLEELQKTGEIPSGYTTYFSLDKYDDPVEAISKMQLNSEWTDAVWVAEVKGSQLVGKVEIPKAKWNEADYLEVLTKSFPKWGDGGATQIITKSSSKVDVLRNLKTGEVIRFLNYRSDFSQHLIDVANFSQRKGITGGHNLVKFENYLLSNGIEINRLSTKNGLVDGISEISYQIKKADGSEGWKSTTFTKTTYDPSKISDVKMVEYGKEAMQEGLEARRVFPQSTNTIIKGESSNGIKFFGYQDSITGEITNFHPVVDF